MFGFNKKVCQELKNKISYNFRYIIYRTYC